MTGAICIGNNTFSGLPCINMTVQEANNMFLIFGILLLVIIISFRINKK